MPHLRRSATHQRTIRGADRDMDAMRIVASARCRFRSAEILRDPGSCTGTSPPFNKQLSEEIPT
jgi:hypothetical protein